ncbi:MAG: translation initiation factor IF-2, partial [Bacteroidales bacterium]|nr:translation initiation factor IF-2 [Bacteroidales bacterium]
MAEETKTAVRLSKAAKEFNIGVQTVIEFLGKKGHEIDSNPNSKLTAEQYALLAKEYQSDKAVRQEAENIDLGLGKKTAPITVEDVKNAAAPGASAMDVEDEELRIKKVSLEGPAKKSAKSVKAAEAAVAEEAAAGGSAAAEAATGVAASGLTSAPAKKTRKAAAEAVEVAAAEAPAVEPVEAPKAAKKTAAKKKTEEAAPVEKVEAKASAVAETAAVVEKPAPEKTEAKVEPAAVAEKPESPAVSVATDEDVKPEAPMSAAPAEDKTPNPLKVVGKIDLSELSAKRRRERAVENAAAGGADQSMAPQAEVVSPVAETGAESASAETVQPAVEPAATGAPAVEARPDNFIPTAKVTLTGPRLTGEKIDLGQFERRPKPVASSRDGGNNGGKKKRQRVGEKPSGATVMNAGGGRPNGMGSASVGAVKNNKKKKNNKNAHVQIDEQEVEKTLKDTLARLSPLGKSKTSKHRREKRHSISQHMEEEQERMMQEQRVLKVTEFVTVNELATMMNVPVTDIISTCMSLGLFVSINQRLTADPISLLAEEYGYTVEFVDAEVMDELEHQDDDENVGEGEPRTPIVTVMGHVDHGKTSLLDYIRKANVIAGEAGGITQHIGAYEVQLENGKKITFLDTPGHEAFTAMRARGAKITDIAIIVVAADDKVMPQTVEAINHAQAAGVPIVFAINKIDKPQADPDKIKTELADMNLLVEEWGGKYQSQDISAKKGLNVDSLLEKVLLEAEMLELKANPNRRGKGTVVESSLDKGRGYVAKILVQDGSVSVGDPIIAGSTCGRVKAMYNERNQPVKTAGPSTPVLLLGLNGAPQAGDTFNVTKDEKEAKDIANRRLQLQREQGLRTQKHITLDEIGRRIAIGDFKELNVIVKGDV